PPKAPTSTFPRAPEGVPHDREGVITRAPGNGARVFAIMKHPPGLTKISRKSAARDVRQMASGTVAPSSGTLTATAPSRTASDTADSPVVRRVQWLNTRFSVNTTITVEVMLDPKMTWKLLGKCS